MAGVCLRKDGRTGGRTETDGHTAMHGRVRFGNLAVRNTDCDMRVQLCRPSCDDRADSFHSIQVGGTGGLAEGHHYADHGVLRREDRLVSLLEAVSLGRILLHVLERTIGQSVC